ILTTQDDDALGESINSDLCPEITPYPAVAVWFTNANLSGMRIRWADVGQKFYGAACATVGSISTSVFEFCNTGVYANNSVVTLSTSWAYDVTTPTVTSGCTLTGSLPIALRLLTQSLLRLRWQSLPQKITTYGQRTLTAAL